MSRFKQTVLPPRVELPAVSAMLARPAQQPAPEPQLAPPLSPIESAYNPFRRVAFLFGLGFIFVQFSFLHEIIGITLRLRSFLPALFGIPAVIGVILSGGLRRAFSVRSTYWWILFLASMGASVVFSAWPGESMRIFSSYVRTQFPAFLIIAGLVITWKEFRWVLYTIAAAGVVNELTGRYLSKADSGGRLMLDIVTIGNANDFAAQLLLILPVFWFVLVNPYVPRIVRMLMLVAIPYAMYLSLRTGSRGALVAMVVAYLFTVIRATGAQRLLIAITVPLLAAVVFATIPGTLIERFSTLYESNSQELEATASTEGRKHLLMESLKYTAEHPLVGVGPGQFSTTAGADNNKQGVYGPWMQAHNSYTQLSSEAGIPALLFLLLGLLSAYRGGVVALREGRRMHNKLLEQAAFALMVALASFCACAFFLSLAYRFYFPCLGGLGIALAVVTRREFAVQTAATAAARR